MRARRVLNWIALGALALSGCKAVGPITSYKDENYVVGIDWRLAAKPKYWDVSVKPKPIPVHSQDSGFLTGSTNVKADGGLDFAAFSTGLEAYVGEENFVFTTGLDLDFDLTSVAGSREDGWLYDWKQQSSDRRHPGSGSFVYDRIDPPIIAFAPFIGARMNFGRLQVNPEVGLVSGSFEREWGHHRFGKEEKIGSESDSALGLKLSLGLNYDISDEIDRVADRGMAIGLEVSRESYSLDFGDIGSTSVMLTVRKAF